MKLKGWYQIQTFMKKKGCEMKEFIEFIQYLFFYIFKDYDKFIAEAAIFDNINPIQVYLMFLNDEEKKDY